MSYETTHTLINIQYTRPYTHTHTLFPMKTLRVRISMKTILSMLIVIADISDNDSGTDNTYSDT